MEPLRHLVVSGLNDTSLASNVTTTLFAEADKLAELVFVTRINLKGNPPDEPRLRGESLARGGRLRNAASNSAAESCNALFYLLIAEDDWKEKEMAILKGALEKNGKLSGWTWSAKNMEKMKAFFADTPEQRKAAPQRIASQRHFIALIAAYLNVGQNPTEGGVGSGPDNYEARPYLSIIYASIMAQLGHPEAALIELDYWLEMNRLRRTQWAKAPPVHTVWFTLRTLSMISTLADEWTRRPSAVISASLRDYQIKKLLEYTSGLEKYFILRAFKDQYAALH
jgi:hypothetical protein